MLCRLLLMGQAALLDGQFFDLSPSLDDGVFPTEVDVGGSEVGEAFVVAVVVVVHDEGTDAGLKIARQIVVFQQDAVLQGLMPTFDLTLGLGMVWCTADVIHTLVLEPVREITGDVGRAVVAEQTGFVNYLGAATT